MPGLSFTTPQAELDHYQHCVMSQEACDIIDALTGALRRIEAVSSSEAADSTDRCTTVALKNIGETARAALARVEGK